MLDLTASSTVQVVVGTGGTGGPASGGTGAPGTYSRIGHPVFSGANGGLGGVGANTPDTVAAPRVIAGGVGGVATTTGDINLAGQAGFDGIAPANNVVDGGRGGASYWGAGADGGTVVTTGGTSIGTSAVIYGSGGGGGAIADQTTGALGGNGASGVVVFYEYGPFTGIMSIGNGGTGIGDTPTVGQLLVGNASGGYTLTGTSSLGYFTTQNSWTAWQDFAGGASTTRLSVSDTLFVETASTTNLRVVGSATSTFAGGIETRALNITGSATSTFGSGINLATGCFSIAGQCIGQGGGGVQLGDANIWTALQTFSAGASTTNISVSGTLYAETASTTNLSVVGSATSTFAGGISTKAFNITGVATSTAQNGFNIASGCFAVGGVCITSGSAADGSFSTTSADYWDSTKFRWSTTSSDFWKSQNNFFSTTSADYFESTQWRWATSSTNYWESTQWRWATTSSDYWETRQWRWATTSSDYWLTLNQGQAFSTTSSNVSVNAFLHASTTIPKTFTGNAFTALQTFLQGASSTNISASGTGYFATASTTNLTVGSVKNSILWTDEIGRVSATTTINFNLINGVLGEGKGGTGQSTYVQGDILYASAANTLSRLAAGSPGEVLKVSGGGVPFWTNDLTSGGGGGAGAWATTTNNMVVYPADAADIIVIGDNATTTDTQSVLEVMGKSYFSDILGIATTSPGSMFSVGNIANFDAGGSTFYTALNILSSLRASSLVVTGSTQLSSLTASGQTTLQNASTTQISVSGTLYAETASTTNLSVVGSATSTFAGGISIKAFNITGSATSTAQNGFNIASGCFSVNGACMGGGSGAADGSFSTTSADYWDSTKFRWSTTSSDFWKSQNNFFSTTSADYFESTQWRWATTSSDYWLTQNQGQAFSTSSSNFSVNAFISGSTTIPKTFAQNIWTALQYFERGASTTIFSALNSVYVGDTATTTIQGMATGTSTIQGYINVLGSTNSTSTFSGNLAVNKIAVTGSASSSFANGINIASGCFAVNGACIGQGGGGAQLGVANTWTALQTFSAGASSTNISASGTVYSETASTSNLTISNIRNSILSTDATGITGALGVGNGLVFTNNTLALSFGTTTTNTWTALQHFYGGATTTILSVYNKIFVGGNATTTIQGDVAGTSTIQGFINVSGTNSTSTFSHNLHINGRIQVAGNSTSSFSNGVNISGGCFAVNGVCLPSSAEIIDSGTIYASTTPGTGGIWTAPVGLIFAQVIVTGGGGGGGEADCDDATCEVAAGGGGAGATTIEMLTAAELGATKTITVGAGGAGGTGGTGANGSAGGLSALGVDEGWLIGANGGAGGDGVTNATIACGTPVPGGAATTTGDVNIAGGQGNSPQLCNGGSIEYLLGGAGGASYWGPGGPGGAASAAYSATGTVAMAWGAGGGGASVVDTPFQPDGGRGATGTVMVISYTASGGDLAEWYETKGGVEPGDIVAVSSETLEYDSYMTGLQRTAIMEKAAPGSSVVGVVSTMPNQVIGGDLLGSTKDARPIALAGRVPVKVSEENGKIKAGDKLTLSSAAGVAMRATKAGVTIGKALEDSSCSDDEPGMEGNVCKIMILVNTSYSSGMLIKDILDDEGLEMDAIPATLDPGRILLAKMIKEKQKITETAVLSEINTDRIVAGLEIVTPRIVTDTLVANSIEPAESDIRMRIVEGGKLLIERIGVNDLTVSFDGATTSESALLVSIDDSGSATFAGTVLAAGLEIGSSEKPSGITMYDALTGDPYCSKIVGGKLQTFEGKCGEESQEPIENTESGSEGVVAGASTERSSPPIIIINGNNPARIEIGQEYSDLGATVSDDHDNNLGIRTYVDGEEVQQIQLDTSSSTIYTIRYTATDTDGNVTSERRIVIVGSEEEEEAEEPLPDSGPTVQEETPANDEPAPAPGAEVAVNQIQAVDPIETALPPSVAPEPDAQSTEASPTEEPDALVP